MTGRRRRGGKEEDGRGRVVPRHQGGPGEAAERGGCGGVEGGEPVYCAWGWEQRR